MNCRAIRREHLHVLLLPRDYKFIATASAFTVFLELSEARQQLY